MEDRQFCKIANHSVKTVILYENDSTISFLDHPPLSKWDAAVIPKTHFVNIYEIDCSTLNEATRVAKLLAVKLNEKYAPLGINLLQNNGEYAGQTVFHFHLQIISRYDDKYVKMPGEIALSRTVVDAKVLEPMAKEIRKTFD